MNAKAQSDLVIPVETGNQKKHLDSCLRRNDKKEG